MARSRKSKFVPRHPEKYKGNVSRIICRSSWEKSFCVFLDNNPNILEWASEEIVIPYIKPTDGKVHRYFPDFWVRYRNKSGQLVTSVLEVKPHSQTKPPTTKRKRQQLYEQLTYAVNLAKWKAATEWCKKNGTKFQIVTEYDLFR